MGSLDSQNHHRGALWASGPYHRNLAIFEVFCYQWQPYKLGSVNEPTVDGRSCVHQLGMVVYPVIDTVL